MANDELIAVVPGSYCPPTLGHGDIIERAAKMFDKVYWAIGINPMKKYLFSVDERKDMMQHMVDDVKKTKGIDNIIVDSFEDSVVRYAQTVNAKGVVKGLRGVSDLSMEHEMAAANRGICPDIETIALFSKPHYATISSTVVREVAFLGESIDQYVHPYVAQKIYDRVKEIKEKK